ncbi:L-alanine-DL-glutamate epimerase-like enolase superfamily enzyme [Homoserinimonas aerilata]|uniref:L-alanine-DL-glutamate epimerase-like enolase superfamily enzyme n=1 Tax=Homoserinimonas aerilata TaxID=1162970 RepID=A0A542YAA3_9MICO|nr:mandelate racemase/muconate lactonizing enzyme family protein [Homoserinimonas aerilata]TQL45031.1 L-alanine-DL-glutamate epimerase-like enolase superfamily enzyme [Homoserinimonas aerilata]
MASPDIASTAADARITRIETIPLRVRLERSAEGSGLSLTHRCAIVTRIHTDAGIVGECFLGNDDELQPRIIAMIRDELEPLLIGRRIVAIDEAWDATRASTVPFLRDRRIALRAQACVDAAMHDALGKIAGLPINVMWGAAKQRIPVFALGGYYRAEDDLGALHDEVAELRDFGIGGLKIKVGKKSPREDARRVAAARDAAGADFVIAADANQGWSRQEALEFTRLVDGLDLAWFEEPCRWENDRQDMAVVRSRGGIPIAAGQSELSRFGCRELLLADAIDMCNFDAYWGGGPSEWRRVAALASAFGVTALQHIEPQIGLMMAAGVPNSTLAEVFLPWRDPFFYRLIADMPERPFRDGFSELPTGPGWGFRFDEDYLRFATRGAE